MSNIYYNPEDFGLETIGEFDWAEPDYSFDMCVIWKEKRGVYWIGNDSGCSCPSPFEDITDINELDGPYDKAGLKSRLDYLVNERGRDDESYYTRSKAELSKDANSILDRIK